MTIAGTYMYKERVCGIAFYDIWTGTSLLSKHVPSVLVIRVKPVYGTGT